MSDPNKYISHLFYVLLKQVIGHGAYGVVISALDKVSGEKYAIKKIAKTFDNNEDAKRILREIILMKRFNHENIIKMVIKATLAALIVFAH